MIKISAEARCPISYYEEYTRMLRETLNKHTKAELIAELETYKIYTTLRARKSTLVELLAEKIEDAQMTNIVEATKVKPDNSHYMIVGLLMFLTGSLVVFAWESGVSFAEMLGVFLVGVFTIGGVIAIFKCYNGLGLGKKGM